MTIDKVVAAMEQRKSDHDTIDEAATAAALASAPAVRSTTSMKSPRMKKVVMKDGSQAMLWDGDKIIHSEDTTDEPGCSSPSVPAVHHSTASLAKLSSMQRRVEPSSSSSSSTSSSSSSTSVAKSNSPLQRMEPSSSSSSSSSSVAKLNRPQRMEISDDDDDDDEEAEHQETVVESEVVEEVVESGGVIVELAVADDDEVEEDLLAHASRKKSVGGVRKTTAAARRGGRNAKKNDVALFVEDPAVTAPVTATRTARVSAVNAVKKMAEKPPTKKMKCDAAVAGSGVVTTADILPLLQFSSRMVSGVKEV